MVWPLAVLIQWVCNNGLQINLQIFASYMGFESGVMRGFQKGIILGGRTSWTVNSAGSQNWVAKIFAKFASDLGFNLGVMRGFQKGNLVVGSLEELI